MRIAICFSGGLRSSDQTSQYIKRYIGDLWDNCDFFLHTWDHESISIHDTLSLKTNIIALPSMFPMDQSKIDRFCDFYQPKVKMIEEWTQSIAYIGLGEPLWESFAKVISLKKEYEQTHNFTYDFVVRIRPDILIHSSKSLEEDISDCSKFPRKLIFCDINNRNEHSIQYIEDVFFISDSITMDHLSMFNEFRLNSNLGNVDWQHHMCDFVANTLGKRINKMKNNMAAILYISNSMHGGRWEEKYFIKFNKRYRFEALDVDLEQFVNTKL